MTATRTTAPAGRVVVLDVVGLRPAHLASGAAPTLADLLGDRVAPLEPPFPAVTIPAQTTMATGRSPAAHGDVANGEYDRDGDVAEFWERDREDRTRLWEAASDEADLTTGALCFQHLVGTTADVAVTPSPIKDENNDLVEMNCWTNPDGFYDDLEAEYGHFPLHTY
jgi:predicted AlkP superfamily pyrophosphatase or phosphodiesterase